MMSQKRSTKFSATARLTSNKCTEFHLVKVLSAYGAAVSSLDPGLEAFIVQIMSTRKKMRYEVQLVAVAGCFACFALGTRRCCTRSLSFRLYLRGPRLLTSASSQVTETDDTGV